MLPRIPARISLALLALMFSLPFLNPYHFHPLTNFYTEWLALALGLAALLPLSVKRFWGEVEIPALTLWLLGFAALLPLQIVWLDIAYPELSMLGALYVIWAALLVWLGRVLVKSCGMEDLVVWLAAMLLLGGLLNAGAALLQFYGLDSRLGALVASLGAIQRGAYGNLGQNNHFADYLTLALISAVYLQIKGRLRWPAAAICIGMLLYALSLSGSKAAWLYLLAMLALSLWLRARSTAPALRQAAIAIAVLVPLFGLLQYAMAHYGLATRPYAVGGPAGLPITAIDRFADELARGALLPEAGGSALRTRLYMWHQAFLMWSSAPLLGVGFGQYAGVFFQQAAELSWYQIPNYDRNAHNALMQLLAETGLLGAGLVCAGLGSWLLGLRQRIAPSAENWWTLGLLSVLFVHSMVEYPLWHANFLGVAAVLLGMSSQRGLRLRLTSLSRYAFPLMLVAGFATLASVLQSYRDLESLMYPRVLPQNREELFERNEGLLRLHRNTLLAPYVEMTYAGSIVADRSNLQDKLELNRRVLRLMPVPELAYRQVLLLALNGEQAAALLQLDRAAAVYGYRLKEFVAQAEIAAQQEPEALKMILNHAREKLKQVDRKRG